MPETAADYQSMLFGVLIAAHGLAAVLTLWFRAART